MNIQFTVAGIAAPQGSKTPYGTEANKNTRPWRATVTADAARTMGSTPKFVGPVWLDIRFEFPRPKSHYGTGRNAGRKKLTAPEWHTSKPDADKLARAIGDALTGTVFHDDSQVCRLTISKTYADKAAAHILVMELTS